MNNRIAVASMIDVAGDRIWIPPTGRPYWCGRQPCRDLTDEELEKYGLKRLAPTLP